ncbi:hypothetical protein V6N12_044308 [Hibiscus sabdariffa]|uniref:Phorbol-ester/DAG-type domain-containing protein n=1 Tax=Hibiscus sabdariffa TaxID=183260 RepID=A0ABR2DGW4_9ROSI
MSARPQSTPLLSHEGREINKYFATDARSIYSALSTVAQIELRASNEYSEFLPPLPAHPQHFTDNSYYCHGCFNLDNGFRCICKYKCNFQMHVGCALKPSRESEDAEDGLTLLHFTHQHPLKPVDLKLVDRVSCAICENLCYGSVYGCQICNVFLHNTCMETIPWKIRRKLHVASDPEVSRCLSGSSFHP